MCDQYDHRGCEIVDDLYITITRLQGIIADLKKDIVEDLKFIKNTHFASNISTKVRSILEKWEAK